MQENIEQPEPGVGQGPKFFVNIEGELHPWPRRTITTEEIAHRVAELQRMTQFVDSPVALRA